MGENRGSRRSNRPGKRGAGAGAYVHGEQLESVAEHVIKKARQWQLGVSPAQPSSLQPQKGRLTSPSVIRRRKMSPISPAMPDEVGCSSAGAPADFRVCFLSLCQAAYTQPPM